MTLEPIGGSALQIRWEQGLHAGTTTFLDRALPDSVTFYRLVGMDPDEILGSCFRQCERVYGVISRSNNVLRSVRNRPLDHVPFMDVGKSQAYA